LKLCYEELLELFKCMVEKEFRCHQLIGIVGYELRLVVNSKGGVVKGDLDMQYHYWRLAHVH